MAVHPMILDNRVHRTIPMTTGATPFIIASSDTYDAYLKATGNQDYLYILTKDGKPAADPIPLIGSFTPPHCSSPVGRYDNSDCQWALQIDEKLLHVVELRKNLIDPIKKTDQVMVLEGTTAETPAQRTNKLVVQYNGFAAIMASTGPTGIKVPPDLG